MTFPILTKTIKLGLCAAALVSVTTESARAQETDAEAAARLALRILNHYSVLVLRSTVDLTYENLSVSPKTYDAVITGLEIYPLLDWDENGECIIKIDRVATGSIYSFETSDSLIEVNGLTVPRACLDPAQSAMLLGMGYDTLTSDTMSIRTTYDLPSAAAEIALTASVDDALDLTMTAGFDYLWFNLGLDGGDGEPYPVALLGDIEIALENRGLWEKVEPIIGAQFGDVSAVPQMVQGMVLQGLASPDGTPPRPEVDAFAANLGAEIGRFLTEKNRLVIASNAEDGVWLDEDIFDDPQTLIAELAPTVSATPRAIRSLIDPARLAAALSGGGITDDERRAIGEALLTGIGAPLSITDGRSVLAPLADAWDGRATALIARASAGRGETEDAYAMALRAMSASETVGISVGDELEPGMPLADILRLQEQAGANWPEAAARAAADQAILDSGDVSALRQRAYDAALGRGLPRDYRGAYFWSVLASAAGDQGANTLRQRLDTRFASGPDAEIWSTLAGEAGSAAYRTWTEGGLAETILTRFGNQ